MVRACGTYGGDVHTRLWLKKGKVRPRTAHEGPEGRVEVEPYLSLTSAGGGWLTPRPGRFTSLRETLYLLYRRLGGPQDRPGQMKKNLPHRDSIPGPSLPCGVMVGKSDVKIPLG